MITLFCSKKFMFHNPATSPRNPSRFLAKFSPEYTPVFSLNLLEDTSANRKQLREEIWKVFGSLFEGPGSRHLNRLPEECLHSEKMKFS